MKVNTAIPLSNGMNGITINGANYQVTTDSNTTTLVIFTNKTIPTNDLLNNMAYKNISLSPTAGLREITLSEIKDTGGDINGGINFANPLIKTTVAVQATPVEVKTIAAPITPIFINPIISEYGGQNTLSASKTESTIHFSNSTPAAINFAIERPSSASTTNSAYSAKTSYNFETNRLTLQPNITQFTSIVSALRDNLASISQSFTIKPMSQPSDFQAKLVTPSTGSESSILQANKPISLTDQNDDTNTTYTQKNSDNEDEVKAAEKASASDIKNLLAKRETFQSRISNLLKDFGILPPDDTHKG